MNVYSGHLLAYFTFRHTFTSALYTSTYKKYNICTVYSVKCGVPRVPRRSPMSSLLSAGDLRVCTRKYMYLYRRSLAPAFFFPPTRSNPVLPLTPSLSKAGRRTVGPVPKIPMRGVRRATCDVPLRYFILMSQEDSDKIDRHAYRLAGMAALQSPPPPPPPFN